MNERDIFIAALLKDDETDRAAYLGQACGDDAALCRRVQVLLRTHEQAGSFLDSPAPEVDATVDEPGLTERPGTVIGPYKLLEQIGDGGMGVVYMADQQTPVKRRVALKIIKPGMDTRQVIARFEAERQALALMDHPNIARVLDAGATESGRPYFVMELVRGIPITEYCDQNNLPVNKRLELFVIVCHAVQHAHQKGIIHRDIKPSNVMITLHDGEPVPKVIDFGVAKATNQQLTDKTLFTSFTQMIGTPLYMSPEQAEMSSLDVDTRTDIYALGVLLYELLTGSTPFGKERFQAAAFDEIRRIIREEEPAKPSTRMSTLVGANRTAVAAHRHVDASRLSQLMRGDLDWIVMKALEKDRTRRYDTANSFAADVECHLSDQPVEACPPSAVYRFRKFARRNRVAITTAALLSATLLLGTVISTWQAIRATGAEGLAQTRLHAETEARNATSAQLLLTEQAENQAMRRLYDARVAQANAGRFSRRVGQRFNSLAALAEATKIARDLEMPEEELDERLLQLRNEAIACMALPDLRVAKELEYVPGPIDFDGYLKHYARSDRQGTVSVRRVADDSEIVKLPGPGPSGALPLFSRDGRFLAVTYWPGHGYLHGLRMWNLDGAEPVMLVDEAWQVTTCNFSPDGRLFAFAVAAGPISMIELPSGDLIRQVDVGPLPQCLIFHPKKPQFAVAINRAAIHVCELDSGTLIVQLPEPQGVDDLAWHPDGKTLAAVGSDREIHLWDVTTGQPSWVLEGLQNGGIQLNFSHNGNLLASSDWNGSLRLWDPGTGKQVFQTQGALNRPSFSQDDRLLATEIGVNTLRLWEVAAGREYRTIVRGAGHGPTHYQAPSIRPDGKLLAIGMADGFGLWDLQTGAELAVVRDVGATFWVLFEPLSGSLLTDSPQFGLLRWPIQAHPTTPGALKIGPPQRVLALSYNLQMASSADGSVLASAQYQGGIVLHTDRSDDPVRLGPHGDVRYIAVSPDGRWVATGSHNGTEVKVWDAQSGELVKELPADGWRVGFSPDGKWLATNGGGGGRGCRLWAVGSWEAGTRVGGTLFAFSPDSKVLAVETGHGAVRLVDPNTGREFARLEDPNQDIVWPLFSPDGTQLVTTNNSNTNSIHIWDLRAIRSQLADMGLHWDLPAYPPRNEPVGNALRGVPSGGVPSGQNRNGTEAVPYRHSRTNGPTHDAAPLAMNVDLGELAQMRSDESRLRLAEAHARQAQAYLALKQWHKALAEYASALEQLPKHALSHNNLAWLLATCPDPKFRDAAASLEHATRAVELEPKAGHWNTLGVAHYRTGNWPAAIESLEKSEQLSPGEFFGDNAFFLAMAHWQVGNTGVGDQKPTAEERASHKEHGRNWYEQAVEWMEKNKPQDEELNRFRAEAAELLGVQKELPGDKTPTAEPLAKELK